MPIGRAIRIVVEILIILFCVFAIIHEYHTYTPKEKSYIKMPK